MRQFSGLYQKFGRSRLTHPTNFVAMGDRPPKLNSQKWLTQNHKIVV
ncbi:MAG: hypothetical protein JGK40_31360 [Microcoleus sp. PH2017_21_RUC_O_A]|nr:hypothetical protein [Microcoleus sp. PH2017_21_RUC_O_A]MCC3532445.1 hypothetical protein [Microcoleus sp. PH2017_21_RUC_O_A]